MQGSPPPPRRSAAEQGVHVWNGAHGHGEVGNVLVGLVHAFIDALLHNRALAVSSEGLAHFRRFGAFPAGDLGTQARLVTLLSTRPLLFSDCHLTNETAAAATTRGAMPRSLS